MKVVLIGQAYLAAEVLSLCQKRGDSILAVIAPRESDRLFQAAKAAKTTAHVAAAVIDQGYIPDGADIILAAHAHAFISAAARAKTRYGALGYHPSLLPRHRGRDAVRWTIHMGDKVAGGTLYWMDDGADTGAIAAQDWCHVLPDDDARSLWQRDLAPMGLRLFEKVLAELDQGGINATIQNVAAATWEPAFNSSKLKARTVFKRDLKTV